MSMCVCILTLSLELQHLLQDEPISPEECEVLLRHVVSMVSNGTDPIAEMGLVLGHCEQRNAERVNKENEAMRTRMALDFFRRLSVAEETRRSHMLMSMR